MINPKNIEEIKEFYINNGYVMLEPLVSDSELKQIEDSINMTMGDKSIGHSSTFDTNDLIQKIPKHIINLVFKQEYIKILKALLNTNTLEIQHSKYNAKNLVGGSKVPLHQDFPFFPHTDERLLAFNFYVDGSCPENGGMFCHPRKWEEPLEHIKLKTGDIGIDPKKIDSMGKPVNLIGAPGCISIHSCFLPHSSNDTQGLKRRMMCFQLRHPENKQIGGSLWKCSGMNPETLSYNDVIYKYKNKIHLGRKLWEPKEYFTNS